MSVLLLFSRQLFIRRTAHQMISERRYVLKIVAGDDLAELESVVAFEQVADVFVGERKTAIVVFLEELKVVIARRMPLPALVNHRVEYDQVRVLYLRTQFRGTPLSLQFILEDEAVKEELP